MRSQLLSIISLLIMPASGFSQRPPANEASSGVEVQAPTDERPRAKKCYLIELVEFQFNEVPSAALDAAEMLSRLRQAADDDRVEVIQTFYVSALEGQQSTAEVGLQTSIVTGVTYPQARTGQIPPLRNLQQTQLGSTLRVKAEPADDEISVQVNYAVSRIRGERPEDGPPDIVSFTLQSQLLVVPGQRVLLGGANGSSSNYAALTVTEL